MSPTLTKIPWKQLRRASSYSDSSQFDLSFDKNVEWESLPPDPFSSHLQPYHIPEESQGGRGTLHVLSPLTV